MYKCTPPPIFSRDNLGASGYFLSTLTLWFIYTNCEPSGELGKGLLILIAEGEGLIWATDLNNFMGGTY